MVTNTIFQRDEQKPPGQPFCFVVCVSVPVVKDRSSSQQTLQESVAVAVGVGSVACSVRTKRRKIEGAHRHSNIIILLRTLFLRIYTYGCDNAIFNI